MRIRVLKIMPVNTVKALKKYTEIFICAKWPR